MIIAQISDTHVQTGPEAVPGRLEDLRRTVEAINTLRPRPVAVVHTGDVAHHATIEEYRAARALLDRLEPPLYAIVGNRDRRAPFRAAFASAGYLDGESPFIQYAIDLGGLRLVATDTFNDESGLGGFCRARAAGLERMLSERPGVPALVIAHHPPVEVPSLKARNPLQFHDPAEASAFVDCIRRAPTVAGVVAGHIHRAETVSIAHTRLSTVTSVATDLRRGRDKELNANDVIVHLHVFDGAHLEMRRVVVGSGAMAL